MSKKNTYASIFDLNGVPKFSEALPLALQHVVAMIVGCVTPAIVLSGSNGANLSASDQILLIQVSLVFAALSTLVQLFPLKIGKFQLGSGLPIIMGVSFAYLPSMLGIVHSFDIATILGAQLVGGIFAILVGFSINKIRVLFPPLVTGTVVFTIGLSLYPTAVKYMAGGASSLDYGSWQNWVVAVFTLVIVIVCNHFGKGFVKLASILIGMISGYIFSAFFGMLDFSSVASASIVQLPIPLHFGISFEPAACIAISLLFIVNSIQAIGELSATTSGGLDRTPSNDELKGGLIACGVTNMVSSLFGCLPTATYGQNVGIVVTTKAINRMVLGLAAAIILAAGLLPKFSALLTTIPYCVLGGATISVFASIAMTGVKLIFTEEMNYRNTSIVGLAVALGMGVSQTAGALDQFPEMVGLIFGESPVVIAAIVAIFLNLVLPKGTPVLQKK